MRKLFVILALAIINSGMMSCLCSCEGGMQAPVPLIKDEEIQDITSEDIEPNMNSEAVELLSGLGPHIVCNSITTNKRYFAFSLNDSFYMVAGNSGSKETIRELNLSTGSLQTICKDPLCHHNKLPCINAYNYISRCVYNNELYVLGEYMKTLDDGRKFIGKISIQEGKMEILYEWLPSLSANSLSFEYFDGYLYYTKATSDTTNEIYRFSLSSRKEEQVSSLEDYIVVFAIGNEHIYFRNNYDVLKQASLDFGVVEEIDSGVSMVFPCEESVYYFKNAYSSDGNMSGYNLIRMNHADKNKETVIVGAFNPSMTLYDEGSFYYTVFDYASDKTVYRYHAETGAVRAYPIDYGSRCDVFAVLDHILVLKIFTDFDPASGDRSVEYYLYDTETNRKIPIYCE